MGSLSSCLRTWFHSSSYPVLRGAARMVGERQAKSGVLGLIVALAQVYAKTCGRHDSEISCVSIAINSSRHLLEIL
jgi:hypothetical protein